MTDTTATHSRPAGPIARAALAVIALLGAFLIVFPLATGLPGKSDASGRLLDNLRPVMSNTSLAQGRADQATISTMASQLTTGVIPALATQLKMTPQQLTTYVATNFPAVGKGVSQMAAIQQYVATTNSTLQAQQSNFRQADQIPTAFLPPTSMTLLFVLPGAVLVLVGGFGALRPRQARRMMAAGAAVGLIMTIALLSITMYAKASASDEMTAAFKPVFTQQNVALARGYVDTVQSMSTEFVTKTIPGVATALHQTPSAVVTLLSTGFPGFFSGMTQLPDILQRMNASTTLVANNIDNFNQSASIPWEPGSLVGMFWSMMAPALLVLGIGAVGFLLTGIGGLHLRAAPRLRPILHR